MIKWLCNVKKVTPSDKPNYHKTQEGCLSYSSSLCQHSSVTLLSSTLFLAAAGSCFQWESSDKLTMRYSCAAPSDKLVKKVDHLAAEPDMSLRRDQLRANMRANIGLKCCPVLRSLTQKMNSNVVCLTDMCKSITLLPTQVNNASGVCNFLCCPKEAKKTINVSLSYVCK